MTTAPAPDEIAAGVFGDRLAIAVAYADLLADEGTRLGLIGPGEVSRLWTRHLLNSAVIGDLVEPGSRVVDVGSGAGLPGIPLAIARPDLDVLLIEPLLRRSDWLTGLGQRLGLSNVQVRRARAEEAADVSAPYVTARAVAPLDRLAGWCLPLVDAGGELLAVKGQRAHEELAAAEPVLRRLGAQSWDVVQAGADRLPDPTTVVRVRVALTGHARARRPKAAGPGGSRKGGGVG